MLEYHEKFKKFFEIKNEPNAEELALFQKTQKYLKYVAWIPGLKMIAVCNSLSMFASKKNSDIDLFVITHPKRLWIVRILMTLIFQILGVRRRGNKIAGRFCLSFFVTENALDFSKIAIENDIYLYFWIYYLKPVFDKDETYKRFLEINKSSGFFDSFHLVQNDEALKIFPLQSEGQFLKGKYNYELDNSKILDLLENFLKKIFLPKTLEHKKKLGDPFGLIVSDNILKFHDNDKRIKIRKQIIKNS
ncbi:MAG: hypothetical protein PHO80_00255 [Candidatus Gracilibacteria bacterium]|nr:hypothetical protein [Candidatus Gracilibacteria bacterium]